MRIEANCCYQAISLAIAIFSLPRKKAATQSRVTSNLAFQIPTGDHNCGHKPAASHIDLVHDLVYICKMEVNIHEAKTHFSRLLERVAMGEEVIIAKAGTPVAKLVPLKKMPKKRVFGSAKGDFIVPDDFNDPDPEIEDLFYNGPLLPK